jgi:hypothetical protein
MAIPPLYKGLKRIGTDYGATFVATYREAKAQASDPNDIPFSKEQLVHHGNKLLSLGISSRQVVVKNFPDALYTFRARAELPDEILADGHFAIVGRGKGYYAFVRIPGPNRIRIPTKLKSVRIKNLVPVWVRQYMSNDEQGMLTTIQANGLIAKYLELDDSFRLQSHLRVGVAGYGQVEVDELYVGRTNKGNVGIAVEAKNAATEDCLNVSQLFGTAQAVKARFPAQMPKRLIGAKPDTSGRICLAEFAVADHPTGIKLVRDWCAYELV